MNKDATEILKRLREKRDPEAVHRWAEKVYKRDKALIDKLVEWRNLLRIEINSTFDEGVAYLIDTIHKKHRLGWKRELDKIKNELLKYKGHYETYLNLILAGHQIDMLKNELASGKTKYSPEATENSLRLLKDGEVYFRKCLKSGKNVEVDGIPAKHLPDFFYIARPEHEFYQNEYLKKKLKPLIEMEEAEDIEKLKLINQMDVIYVKHSYKEIYEKRFKKYLVALAIEIKVELKLRKKSEDEAGLKEVRDLDKEIKASLKKQKAIWKNFKRDRKDSFEISLTYALHKDTKKELQQLYQKISKEIDKELARFK